MKRMMIGSVMVGLIMLGMTARAAMFTTPISASASSYITGYEPIHTIDSSGLSGGAHTSTVLDTTWITGGAPNFASTTTIDWDLGATSRIAGFHLWNDNASGGNNNASVKFADIVIASDSAFTQNVTTFTGVGPFTEAPGTDGYLGEDYTLPGNAIVTGEWIRFENFITYRPAQDYVGISEIRFETVPEPSTLLLVLAGGFMLWRRLHARSSVA